ncbi:MAG: hypothetical protein WCW64_04105 [Phycisphaerae bacterium]
MTTAWASAVAKAMADRKSPPYNLIPALVRLCSPRVAGMISRI